METIEINSILRDFYRVSGFRISIHDTQHNEIYSYPANLSLFCERIQKKTSLRKKCLNADAAAFRKAESTGDVVVYRCFCGLYEAVAAIYHYGVLAGFLMMGQVRDASPEALERITETAAKLLGDPAEAKHFAAEIRTVEEPLLNAYINLMSVIAEYITKANRLCTYNASIAPLVRKYLRQNFEKPVTLNQLCDRFGCSKTTLICCYKKEYGSTIISDLNEIRLENAEKMTAETNRAFKEIAADCGFSDQNYFSRLFSARYGVSPGEYRRKARSEVKTVN